MTGSEITIVVPGIDINPFDIAIDAIGRLLFWTCASNDVINITKLENGTMLGIVVQIKGEKPRLIVIHPTKRYIFALLISVDHHIGTEGSNHNRCNFNL